MEILSQWLWIPTAQKVIINFHTSKKKHQYIVYNNHNPKIHLNISGIFAVYVSTHVLLPIVGNTKFTFHCGKLKTLKTEKNKNKL